MRTAVAGLTLFAACTGAHALSVDCAKITNPDENTICSEVSLAKLDNDLSNTYKLMQAQLPLKMRDYMKNAQGQWMAAPERPAGGACKGDMNCIAAKYQERIAYLRNPGLRYEGVYVASKAYFSLASFGDGAVRVGFFPLGPAISETDGKKVADRVLVFPPPAENCSMRIEFNDGGAVVQIKEAKKRACDSVKGLGGTYTRDYAQMPRR